MDRPRREIRLQDVVRPSGWASVPLERSKGRPGADPCLQYWSIGCKQVDLAFLAFPDEGIDGLEVESSRRTSSVWGRTEVWGR